MSFRNCLLPIVYCLLALTVDCVLLTDDCFAQTENTVSYDGTTNKFWYVGQDTSARMAVGVDHSKAVSRMLTVRDSGTIGSQTFISGWLNGSGWGIDVDSLRRYHLTIDDITVRGSLAVYELLINQIRATNGNLLVTSSAVVDSVAKNRESFWCLDATGNNIAPFVAGDIIICQGTSIGGFSFDSTGAIIDNNYLVKRLVYIVNQVAGRRVYVTSAPGAPSQKSVLKKGDVFCRIGNTTDGNRMGSIGLFADDDKSPYIRVIDSVSSYSAFSNPSSVKVQLGKLTGIYDPAFGGQLQGYGLYSDNAYIKGKIVVTNPSDFTIEMLWDSINNKPAYFNAPSGQGLFISANNMGYYNSSTYPSDPWRTYMDNQGRFYLKGNGGDYLSWNGTTLVIKGNGNALDISSNNSIKDINNTLYSYGTDIYQNSQQIGLRAYKTTTDSLGNVLSQVGTGLTATQNSLTLYAKKDSVVSSIFLTADKARIQASKIEISGATTFSSGYDPSTKTDSSKVVTIIDGKVTANYINALNIIADSIKANTSLSSPIITGGNLNIGNGAFVVGSDGTLTATNATISGTIKTGPYGIDIATNGIYFLENNSPVATFSAQGISPAGLYISAPKVYLTADLDMASYNLTAGGISIGGNSVLTSSSNLNASRITSGTVSAARLGSGTASSSTFLRGDGTWSAVSGSGGGTVTSVASSSASTAALTVSGGTITSSGTFVFTVDDDLVDLADGSLSGSKVGSGINAANITTGTLPSARLSGSYIITASNATYATSLMDDQYGYSYNADAFGATLNQSGTTVSLKNVSSGTLSTITVPTISVGSVSNQQYYLLSGETVTVSYRTITVNGNSYSFVSGVTIE